MSDDMQENGSTNGEVPEIELIIKVRFFEKTRGVTYSPNLFIVRYDLHHN